MTAPTLERRWWLQTVGGSAGAAVVAGIAHPFAGAVFAAGVLGVRIAAVLRAHRARVQRYDDAFLSLLDAIAAHLRSGVSLVDALAATPISNGAVEDDRIRCVRLYELGQPFTAVCEEWRVRHPTEPVIVGTVALAIAYEHGVAVAGALEHLALTVRDRNRARLEIRSQALHARLSAYVISAAPMVFLIVGAGLDPRFLGAAFGAPAGRLCVGLGLVCEVVGWLIIARIVRDPDRGSGRGDQRMAREVPITTDLVGLALGAGLPPIGAVGFARNWCPPESAAVFTVIETRLGTGDSLAQALAFGTQRAPCLAGVLRVLLAAANGAPVQVLVSRLADDARVHLKVQADTRARTIPIRLLFPLVLCILPAFALLTVAPAVLAGLASIQ